MAGGTKRREVVADSLAGEALVNPVRLSGPGISAPATPRPQPSVTADIANALGKWASERLDAEVNKENERQMMDGAIAATQGDTFEQLQLDGADKWSLQGHRVITANTIASTIKAAQLQMIEDSGYALGPDEYREQLTAQMEGLIDGQDPRTARMIRERMTETLPDLVAKQTMAHANHQEQLVYDSMVQAINVTSRDAQGINALLDMGIGGEGSISAGLSDARRKQALMEGIVLSFVDDNPRAYQLLSEAGALEDMTVDQRNRIANAETQYQNRLRTEFNQGRLDQLMALDAKMRSGVGITPDQYLEEYIKIEASFGIEVTMAEAGAAYSAAIDPSNTHKKALFNTAEAARLRGDTKMFAAATEGLVLRFESGALGDEAVSEAGAESAMQVMPPTQVDPGWGLRPSDGSHADNNRLGREYWALMMEGTNNKFGLFNWAPNDLEAAAVAYNAGPANASLWIKAGRDYSALPKPEETKPYAQGIVAAYNDLETPLGSDLYNQSVADLKLARDRYAMDNWSAASAIMAEEDKKYVAGEVTRDAWIASRRSIMADHEVKLTQAIIGFENATTRGMLTAAAKAAKLRNDDAAMREIELGMFGIQGRFEAVVDNPATTWEQMQTALATYIGERDALFMVNGLPVTDKRNITGVKAAEASVLGAIKEHQEWSRDQALIDFSAANGAVEHLPEKLRQRFWQQTLEQAFRDGEAAAKATDGSPEALEDVSRQVDEDQFIGFKDAGDVDPLFRAEESHHLKANLIITNADGKEVASQAAVDSLKRYVHFKTIAPEIADKFYDEKARIKAEVILATAGAGGLLEQAIIDVERSGAANRLHSEATDAFMRADETQDDITRTLDAWVQDQERDLTQAVWEGVDMGDFLHDLPSEERRRRSPEVQAQIRSVMEAEMRRLKALQPHLDADAMVPIALENMKRHSAFVGGSFVFTPNKDIKREMFGAQVNQYDKVGLVGDAVANWLMGREMQARHPELDDHAYYELFPAFVQDAIVGGVEQFNFRSRIAEGMSLGDIIVSKARGGLRPYTSYVNLDGDIVVNVFNEDGVPGTDIILDLQQVGEFWMKTNPNYDNVPTHLLRTDLDDFLSTPSDAFERALNIDPGLSLN